MKQVLRFGLLVGVLLCSSQGVASRDPLIWSHLVVRGVVIETSVRSMPVREFLPGSQVDPSGRVDVRSIRVLVLEVLKGKFASDVLEVWDDEDYCGDCVGDGDAVVVCADFAPYILTGAYRVSGARNFYLEHDGHWIRADTRLGVILPPPGAENSAPLDVTTSAPAELTLAQIRERVAEASPRTLARQADIVAVGTILAVEDSTTIPPLIVKVAMDVESVMKGRSVERLTFYVSRGRSFFDKNVFTQDIPAVGQRWCVFLRRQGHLLLPFAGSNGLLRIEGSRMIVDGVASHELSVDELHPYMLPGEEVFRLPPKVRGGRFVMPSDDRPGYVHLDSYFKIQDPREAARALLKEAALVGLDLDATGDDMRGMGVPLPAPKMALESVARAYMTDSSGESGSDSTWCVIKLSRWWSIREIATLLDNGIWISRNDAACVIALVPGDKKAFLASREYVQWFQPYYAAMKLNPNYRFPEYPRDRVDVDVQALADDRPEFVRDLERLGADVRGYARRRYWVSVNGDRIPAIAELEWVYTITGRTWVGNVE
jgi:hypothetical protein